MKNTWLFLFLISLTLVQAQTVVPPVIEGTYFPVRNTKIKQIWDTTQGVMNVPTMGANQVWDYTQANGQFVNICDTFDIKVFDPSLAPKNQYFPGAAFAIFMRTPMPNDPFDSLYHFYSADHQIGLRKMGGFNISPMYDSTMTFSPQAFFSVPTMSFGFSKIDTARSVVFVKNYMGLKGKIKSKRYSTYTYVGYGTLKLPGHTYNNVAQVRESWSGLDSIYVDLFNNGNYTYYGIKSSSGKVYNFYRNNTFGTAYLMYLNVNPANTGVEQAFYTLPADIGSISGTVYTNINETTPVTAGEMYLYRENSNFAKHDILAKVPLNSNGTFQFDSIPYGEYRIAARSDTTIYPNALITYFGDTTNWIDATPIITTTLTSPGHKIHVHYHLPPSGANSIHGTLVQNFGIQRTANAESAMSSNPIPGVGIVVKRNPGSSTARTVLTDSNGAYDLGSLEDGGYVLFVDIPGMHMTGTYSFNVSGTASVTGLNFTAGTDSIHPDNLAIGIKELKNSKGGFMSAYPNPYTAQATILVDLKETGNMTLEVYNLLGEKVSVLDKGIKQQGTYTYNFSAKKLNFGSGIYFVKLTIGNKTDVIKLIEE